MAEDRRRRGRRPIDRYWIERMKALCAQEPRPTIHAIAEALGAEGSQLGRNDYPSERTIPALKKMHYDPLSDHERRQYTLARWPESFITGALPWEASATTLGLLRLYLPMGEDYRPTVRAARWFWQVTQAMPRAPSKDRTTLTWVLTAHELFGEWTIEATRRLESLALDLTLPVLRVGKTSEQILGELVAETWAWMLKASVARGTERLKERMVAGEVRPEDEDKAMETERRLIDEVFAFAPWPGFWEMAFRAPQRPAA